MIVQSHHASHVQYTISSSNHTTDVGPTLEEAKALRDIDFTKAVKGKEVYPERRSDRSRPILCNFWKLIHEHHRASIDQPFEISHSSFGVKARNVLPERGVVNLVLDRGEMEQWNTLVY